MKFPGAPVSVCVRDEAVTVLPPRMLVRIRDEDVKANDDLCPFNKLIRVLMCVLMCLADARMLL